MVILLTLFCPYKEDIIDNTYDVLQEHSRKNRPSKGHLRSHNKSTSRTSSAAHSRTRSSSDAESDDVNQQSSQHARRHTKKQFDGSPNNPTQLQFYPERIQQVLSAGKMNWRLWIVMEWAFPSFRERRNEISDCLTRAIAAYEADGGILDDGTYLLSFFSLPKLTIFQATFLITSRR